MSLLAKIYDARWLLALAVLLLYAGSKIRTYNRLKAFKGPFSSGFSQLWHAHALLSFKPHIKYKEVCDKYGPIARIGPNVLVTSSHEILTHMSAVRSPYTRAGWYNSATRYQPGKDHVFSQVDEEKHIRRRGQMGAGYSGKENHALEGSIDAQVSELVRLIRSKYLSTEASSNPMDFAEKMQFLTLDVISDIGFGESFGQLRTDSDRNEYGKSGELGLLIATFAMALGLTKFMHIPFIARALGPSESDEVGFGRMIGNARAVIDARLSQGIDKRSDMLASFARHGLDRDDLVTEAGLQILAGSDTTSASLRGIMLYLLTHHRVYRKLQEEVDAAVRDGTAPLQGEIISDAVARKLPYLQAVIKEGIRIHPPVTDEVPKVVPEGGDTIVVDGKSIFFPGGTEIGVAVSALHMRKDIYGEDADDFRPERWLLEKDEKKLELMDKVHELMFGYGRYQCLGRPIALMEMNKTIFELMRNFDWCLSKPEKPWREINYVGIIIHHDMWVQVTERAEQA